MTIFQETLSTAEKLVDAASRNGTFVVTFKKSLIEKAETFSFLDPFAGEFEYQDGVIRLFGGSWGKRIYQGYFGMFEYYTYFPREGTSKE